MSHWLSSSEMAYYLQWAAKLFSFRVLPLHIYFIWEDTVYKKASTEAPKFQKPILGNGLLNITVFHWCSQSKNFVRKALETLWQLLQAASVSFQSPIISTITNKKECFCSLHPLHLTIQKLFWKLYCSLQKNDAEPSGKPFVHIWSYISISFALFKNFPSRHNIYLPKNRCKYFFWDVQSNWKMFMNCNPPSQRLIQSLR